HLLRSERRRTLTLAAAGVGIVLAIGGMYEMLIPFLVLLGSIIPPIGGGILPHYWFAPGGGPPPPPPPPVTPRSAATRSGREIKYH
ncbi:hypothetical protein CDA38_17745, partial [Klebsiella pneumoniae]